MVNEMVPQLIGVVVVIALLILIMLPIFQIGLGFLGDTFCSTSVQIRSLFNNLFFGALGRAVIPDWIFNLIPLMCPVEVQIAVDNIEEVLADEFMKCFNKFGAGRLDGVFPYGSALCSVIVYDGDIKVIDSNSSLEDFTAYLNQGVDMLEFYSLLLNDSSFPNLLDYDNPGMDDSNAFRLCFDRPYSLSIFNEMYTGIKINDIPLAGFEARECLGEINSSTGNLQSAGCFAPTSPPGIYGTFDADLDDENGCFSLRKGVLNAWQFDAKIGWADESITQEEINLVLSLEAYRNCVDDCNADCLDGPDNVQFIVYQNPQFSFYTNPGDEIYLQACYADISYRMFLKGPPAVSLPFVNPNCFYDYQCLAYDPFFGCQNGLWYYTGARALCQSHCEEECLVNFFERDGLKMVCKDLCLRNCEYEAENLTNYEGCVDSCQDFCDFCPELNDEEGICNPSFTANGKDYYFNFEMDYVWLMRGGKPGWPPEFGKDKTSLKRGTFFIRYWDYTDWIQQFFKETWYDFPEVNNHIIYLGGTLRRGGLFLDPGVNHDFVVIGYIPYVPYALMHAEEVQTIVSVDTGVVTIS